MEIHRLKDTAFMYAHISAVLMRYILAVLAIINFCCALWRVLYWSAVKGNSRATNLEYSYIGSDYPIEYPIGELDLVAMTLHESVHFHLNLSDPVDQLEWRSIVSHPDDFGRPHLGPEFRLFVITFYHQFHCLWKIQEAFVNPDDPTASEHHVQHCLNYLRQTFLCEASDTLEFGDFMERDFEIDRIGGTLVCRDWEKVYDVLDAEYAQWTKWRAQWN